MSEFKAPNVPTFPLKPKEFLEPLMPEDKSEALKEEADSNQQPTEVETELEERQKGHSDIPVNEIKSIKNDPPEIKKQPSSAQQDQEKYQKILRSLNYNAPPGAALPTCNYHLEILKDGSIIDTVKLEGKSYFIVGRVPGCDIVAEHPTISRLHAVFQYVGEGMKDEPGSGSEDSSNGSSSESKLAPGFYIFDLGSTHGTFLNKNRLYPKRYYRIHVGHVVKFGNSTRLYVVGGPQDDEEEESTKSVSELMKEKMEKELERKRKLADGVPDVRSLEENVEEQGISWGMPEDAEEESDLRENPFAMDFDTSELSLDNPKKTLRGWFEREGYELEYDVREKAAGHFICRIDLPLDGPEHNKVFAEVELKGKKKDVVAQCALQACQILDKYGVLRQANHESRLKRKQRDWADDDYYSSDEDSFLDRTGSIEKKREKRMKQAGLVKQETETYDSLLEKDDKFQTEIDEVQKKIKKAERSQQEDEDGIDPLDAYMMDLKTGSDDMKKLKSKLRELTELQSKNRKLLKIAKPSIIFPTTPASSVKNTSIPEQLNSHANSGITNTGGKKDIVQQKPGFKGIVGPRIQFKNISLSRLHSEPQQPDSTEPGVATIDENVSSGNAKLDELTEPLNPARLPEPLLSLPSEVPQSAPVELLLSPSKSDVHVLPGEEVELIQEMAVETTDSKPKKVRIRKPKSKTQNQPEDYDDTDPDYVTWVPPVGQKGDGKTSLNDKLGY